MNHLTKKIIFSPLHIKLGLMKQFFKTVQTEGNRFKYFIFTFQFYFACQFKKKVGAHDSPDLTAHQNEQFIRTMSELKTTCTQFYLHTVTIFFVWTKMCTNISQAMSCSRSKMQSEVWCAVFVRKKMAAQTELGQCKTQNVWIWKSTQDSKLSNVHYASNLFC